MEKINLKQIGIYKIINNINNKFYIGSTSVSFKQRWSTHKRDLNKDIHINKHLQRAWNKYGKEFFIFEIIEVVEDKNKIIEKEQYYLDLYKPYDRNIGYNSYPTAGSPLGSKHTIETKQKMSKTQQEIKVIGEKCSNAKFTNDEVRKIRELYNNGENLNNIALLYDVKYIAIFNIVRNKTYNFDNKEIIKIRRDSDVYFFTKLNYNSAKKIRYSYYNDIKTIRELAILYNVTEKTIRNILRNKTFNINNEPLINIKRSFYEYNNKKKIN